MENRNPLLGIVEKYGKKGKDGAEQVLRIVKAYSDPRLQRSRLFFSHKITGPTVSRGLSLLAPLVAMQAVVKKPLYLPGVGLFEPHGPEGYSDYDFVSTFPSLPFWQREKQVDSEGNARNFTGKVVSPDGSVDFEKFDKEILAKPEKRANGKYAIKLIVNDVSKASVLEDSFEDRYGGPVGVRLSEEYRLEAAAGLAAARKELEAADSDADPKGYAVLAEAYERAASEAVDAAVADASRRTETLSAYLDGRIDLSNVAYNARILEDILWVIGFLECGESCGTDVFWAPEKKKAARKKAE